MRRARRAGRRDATTVARARVRGLRDGVSANGATNESSSEAARRISSYETSVAISVFSYLIKFIELGLQKKQKKATNQIL
jgi:hypothetical protein